MASWRTIGWGILGLGAIGVAVGAGGYGWMQWQAYQRAQHLAHAEALLAQGQPQAADAVLADLTATAPPGAPWAAHAYALRLQALAQTGDRAGLEALAAQLVEGSPPRVAPGQPAWAQAQWLLGEAALDAQRLDEARTRFAALLAQPAGSDGVGSATLGMARLDMAAGRVADARDRLAALLEQLREDDPLRPGVEHALGLCNMHLLLHPPREGGDYEVYTIQRGDTLDSLRRRFNVSPELLMKINGITDPRRLTIGRRLIIPRLELSIVINKTDNTLTLLNHGKFFKKYRVRTGEFDYMTPTGEFVIENKKENPPWNNPRDGRTYPPGDPGNQLGSRWLGFQGSNLGIHEAIDPETIGTYSSNGCVGMLRADVEELYDLVPLRTPVTIIGTIAQPGAVPLNATRSTR